MYKSTPTTSFLQPLVLSGSELFDLAAVTGSRKCPSMGRLATSADNPGRRSAWSINIWTSCWNKPPNGTPSRYRDMWSRKRYPTTLRSHEVSLFETALTTPNPRFFEADVLRTSNRPTTNSFYNASAIGVSPHLCQSAATELQVLSDFKPIAARRLEHLATQEARAPSSEDAAPGTLPATTKQTRAHPRARLPAAQQRIVACEVLCGVRATCSPRIELPSQCPSHGSSHW